MDEAEYLKKRVEDQIEWYDKKSLSNQKKYKLCSKCQIILSASIPILVLCVDFKSIKVTVAILGALVGIITAFMGICKFFENWINYRTTAESLKKEKFFFLTKTGTYSKDNNFDLFVQNIEKLISKEHNHWQENINKKE